MQSPQDITAIVRSAALAILMPANVEDVTVVPDTDYDGHDALRITIVVTPEAVSQLGGDRILNTLVEIHQRLMDAGEQRPPMVDYTTRDEPDASVDPES